MTKRLAFLFLIYDEIEHEEIWHHWFAAADPAKYVIHVHYKNQKPLQYFEDRKLDHCIPTKYADISLVLAHNLLFRCALEDPTVFKMINVSQSCIPLKPFDHVYEALTRDTLSDFNESLQATCFPRCDSLLTALQPEQVFKSSEWFILNRSHAELCMTQTEFVPLFNEVYAPEEHFYITCIRLSGGGTDMRCTPHLAAGATTFTNWIGMDYPWPPTQNRFPWPSQDLKNYKDISTDELTYLLHAPCLFGRKFRAGCTVDHAIPLLSFFAKGDHPGPPLFKPTTTE